MSVVSALFYQERLASAREQEGAVRKKRVPTTKNVGRWVSHGRTLLVTFEHGTSRHSLEEAPSLREPVLVYVPARIELITAEEEHITSVEQRRVHGQDRVHERFAAEIECLFPA